jgi:hypothetical protein
MNAIIRPLTKGEKTDQRFKWILCASLVTSSGWDDVFGKRRFSAQAERCLRRGWRGGIVWQGKVKDPKESQGTIVHWKLSRCDDGLYDHARPD